MLRQHRVLFLRSLILTGFAFSCLSHFSPSRVQAQIDISERIPNGSTAVVSLRPQQLFEREAMKLAPLEVFTAAGLESIGIDPLKIAHLDLIVGPFNPMQPEFGFLVQMTEPVDPADLNPELMKEPGVKTDDDMEYYQLNAPVDFRLHLIDDKSAIIGTANIAKQMMRTGHRNVRLARLAKGAAGGTQDAMAIIDIAAIAPLLEAFLTGQDLARELPANVREELAAIVNATDFLAISMEMGTPENLKLVLLSENEALATQNKQRISGLLDFAADTIVGEAKREMPADSPVGEATHKYLDRVAGTILDSLTPEQSGSRLVVEFSDIRNPAVIGTLTGLLLPAVQASRQAARRVQSMNNLRQIGLAMFNFESAYGSFPSTAALDENEKPVLSWRVAILPFIEQNQLFNEFNLDEPWDSEHNLALLERMPEVYKHPDRTTEPGYTVYQAAVGEDTYLRLDEVTTFGQITDGTSNTIMMVEVDEENAVPWTKPDDYEVDEVKPGVGMFVNGIANVLIGDGSVQTLSESIDPEMLKAMFTRDGGEVIDFR